MTAKELLEKQVSDVSYQLDKVLEGLTEEQLDYKVVPSAFSIREQVEHLCEVYTAVDALSKGQDHPWGEYSVEDKSWSNLTTLMFSLRAAAIALVTADERDETLLRGSAFIVGHDNYHVGQICTSRIAQDPTWNPYSIYNH